MEKVAAEAFKAALDAQVATLVLVMLIVSLVVAVLIARLIVPIWRANLDRRLELDNRIAAALEKLTGHHEEQIGALNKLQNTLNGMEVNLNLRFDQLPENIRQVVGAEIARRWEPGGRRPGFLARLLGVS